MRLLGLGVASVLLVVAACGKSTSSPRSGTPEPGIAGEAPAAAGETTHGGGPSQADGASGGAHEAGGESLGGAPSSAGAWAGAGGEAETSTVVGHVLYGREPVPGVLVALGDSTTTTDAQGSFTFASAPASYRLTLVHAASYVALVLDDLRSREPSVQLPALHSEGHVTSVSGKISGTTGTPSQTLQLAFAAETQGTLARLKTSASETKYTLGPYWYGNTEQAGTLWALSYETGTGDAFDTPTKYLAYAQRSLTIVADETLGWPDGAPATLLELAEVPAQRSLSGQVRLPDGYVSDAHSRVDVGPFVVPFTKASKQGGAYACLVPQIPDLPVTVRFGAVRPSAYQSPAHYATSFEARLAPASGELDFDLPAVPERLTPANDEQNVTFDTAFSWAPLRADLVARNRFRFGSWQIWRIGPGSSTTVPDLSAYGVTFPTFEVGYWMFMAVGPASDVDEAARLNFDSGLVGEHYLEVATDEHTFQLAP